MGRKKKNLPPDATNFANQTPLRALERKYKNRFTELDLNSCFDALNYEESNLTDERSECFHPPPVDSIAESEYQLPLDPPPAIAVQLSANLQDILLDQLPSDSAFSAKSKEATKDSTSSKGFFFPVYPGLIYVPNALPVPVQQHFALQSLKEYTKPPNYSNVDAHWEIPDQGLWDAHMTRFQEGKISESNVFASNTEETNTEDVIPLRKHPPSDPTQNTYDPATPPVHLKPLTSSAILARLRWCTLGYQYYWATKSYVEDKQYPFPDDLAQLVRTIAIASEKVIPIPGTLNFQINDCDSLISNWCCERWQIQWGTGFDGETYKPQAGVLNFYGERDALMSHIDRSENNMEAPLISVSIGSDCIFVVGGKERQDWPISIRLRSGDVIIMSGECRKAFHGVPRIIENTLPPWVNEQNPNHSMEWYQVLDYMRARNLRINLNVRQVF